MLVFWTMERSLPFGRPPDPAGRPQCMRQAVGTENGAAQPEPDSAPWPGQRLPSSSLPSLLPLSPQPPPPPTPPLKAQHPPHPSASPRPSSLPLPAPAPPLAAPPPAPHRQWRAGGRGARRSWLRSRAHAGLRPAWGEGGPLCSDAG